MNKPATQPVEVGEPSVVYVQVILSPEDNARLDAVCEANDFKKGGFAAKGVMERVARFEAIK